MRRSAHSRRTRRLAGVAAIAAIAVVIAGCSSTKPPAGATAGGVALQGITASTVKVGFTIVDLGPLAKSLGFADADYGGVSGQTKVIQSVVSYINANGGAGGRQIQADIKVYPGSTDSPEQAQAQCSGYTQDDQVFGIVMFGMLQTDAMPCYKAAHTIILDETQSAHDQTDFQNNSPYLWSPTHPEYGGFLKAQLASMNAQGFFTGNTGVLLMPGADEVSRRVTSQIALPYLQSIGITKTQVQYVDSTNIGSLNSTAEAALTAGKNANLNRSIVISGNRIQPVVLTDPGALAWNATWGISTYDDPAFLANNPTSVITQRLVGQKGIGYAPAADLANGSGPAFPDPNNAAQQKCVQIISAAGATPPDNLRANWSDALQYCDGAMFMKDVLDQIPGTGTVTGEQFKDAVAKIGPTYHSAWVLGSQWGLPDQYAGTNTAQVLTWDVASKAYTYGTGANLTFGASAAVAGSGSTAASTPSASSASSAPTSSGAASSGAGGGGSIPLDTITAYSNP